MYLWRILQRRRARARPHRQFAPELVEVDAHKCRALFRQFAACLGGHPVAQSKQFAKKMVEHVVAIVRRVLFGEGIAGMIAQRLLVAPYRPRDGPAHDADSAQTIQTIRVAHHPRFQRAWLDAPAETVRMDGMKNSLL